MNSSNMKNIVVLNNLPSNMIEEAIVILKENKKIKNYQYIEKQKKNYVQNIDKTIKNETKDYILKEAEMIISDYISEIEKKSPKWKQDMKKLENRYKKSLKLNFFLAFATIISLIISFV